MSEEKKKGIWDKESLRIAVDKVLSKIMSLREASLRYNVPKSTLHGKIMVLKRGEEVTLHARFGRFTKTFAPEYEQVLVAHVEDLSNRCMPLMKREFLKLAFDLAESMKIPHRFNREKQAAGKHFYYDFLQRHSNISLRVPESTSIMRGIGFNKPQVDLFYNNLEKLMTQYKFSPSNINNCDETGVSCVHKHQKVLAPKAVRQVGKLTSAERGKNITILFCMNANGYFIPPFFIFPRIRMNDRLMINAPAESVGVAQPKGWMNSDFFLKWLQLFEKYSHPTKENPVLLLLDGHCSHKTLAVIIFCRENNIHLISSPPHTTHKLQPLDRTFMKPFKDAYNQQCDLWMRANAGSRITDFDIAGLVKEAFTKVARLDIAVSGFKCTGIFPFNRHLFSDLDYLAADMTNIPIEVTEASSGQPSCSGVSVPSTDLALVGSSSAADAQELSKDVSENPTDPSKQPTIKTIVSSIEPSTSSQPDIVQIVHKLSPLPNAAIKRSAARKRKCEKSEILTSSAYKRAAEEKENEKNLKDKKKEIRGKFQAAIEENGKRTKGLKSKGKSGSKPKVKEPLAQINTERTTCVVCLEDHDEDWIQCSSCQGWAHEACADIPECGDAYICDRCTIF